MWKIAEIRLKQLEKSFEVSKNSHPVLRRFSTDLDTEKITVILGRSGCGKTTLLRILAGLETLDGGQILFEQPEKLGVVFQEPRLMPWLTLEQNILFGADKKKHSKSKLKEKAETLLRLTGLEKFGKAYPDQLSGGMMQRAALARALACDASYLLMDEPFAALDHFTRQTMQKEFLRICAEEKMGALFVTHSVDEALLLGDEINRTSSKTQSALLEAMEEKTVTVDGNTMALPDPFIVIATQNPITSGGTQPLPDSQCDRFMVRLSMGYPAFEDEVTILRENSDEDAMQQIHQIATKEDLYRIKEQIAKVVVKDQILEYICRLCEATRSHDEIERGVSTRGAIAVKRMAMANAAFHERNYVIPKDVEEIFIDVCAHRIICNARAKLEENSEQHILQRILEQITPPSLFQ